jgi:16S rRNA (guanine966-N2)-methyltransferase
VSRIVAGAAGGRRVRTPNGQTTRPTSERVREALFSSLQAALGRIDGVRFLDLYAGSGAVGLEAVSRGASLATLVEQHAPTAALARRNAADLGLPGVEVVTAKVERFAASPARSAYDVAFLDPPYDVEDAVVWDVLQSLAEHGWLAAGAVVVVERSSRGRQPPWPPGLTGERSRKYGETTLWYGRATGPG